MKIPALISAVAALLIGCEDPPDPGSPTPRRSDGVIATTSAETKPASAPSAPAATKPARTICRGQSPRDTPETLSVARSASGPPPGSLSYGGKWVWLNVWAAWCKPCKEELPLILGWRDQLVKKGVKLELAFVSIDDDDREMTRLLADQPPGGMRASYWLADDEARKPFFASLGFEDTPTLPVNAFVSPDGKLVCTVEGALEPSDYPALERLLAP